MSTGAAARSGIDNAASDRAPAPLRSLLVVNRGEIARRIFRTAHEMGIRTVAVFSQADAGAPHTVEADEAVLLPGGYLDADDLIAAAHATGAQAIHPGYGFLAENAAFAQAVTDAGLVWVGPDAKAIAVMGDKIAAKQAALEAKMPTLPSSEDLTAGAEVGFPLLVKAAAGGGGRGMRLVESADDLPEAVAAASREAEAGFGDGTVFLERWLARCRHIEIQVLADSHGNVVHLGERECSIQRRHQKIIEESPSPAVTPELRRAMGEAAVGLAEAIGYRSAGTVELLLDDDTGDFYFLEMNTRLQVEHPVTEAVTGIDLVREQLRVAAGEPLGYQQGDVRFDGWAVEARLCAEDPAAGFLPATGVIAALELAPAPEIRWDSGVEPGSVVGLGYDPMLAKAIAWAPTRTEASARLALALERLHLGGIQTNRDYLAAVLRSDAFNAADTTTDFIERVAVPRSRLLGESDMAEAAVAVAMWLAAGERQEASTLGWMPAGWRLGRIPDERLNVDIAANALTVSYRPERDGSFKVTVAGPASNDNAAADAGQDRSASGESDEAAAGNQAWAQGTATVMSRTAHEITVRWNGHQVSWRMTRHDRTVFATGTRSTVTVDLLPRFDIGGLDGPEGGFVAPMPGVVTDVRVTGGERVNKGQTMVVLEGMKMEHHVSAPTAGTVTEVLVAQGDQVQNGTPLLVFEPEEASDDG